MDEKKGGRKTFFSDKCPQTPSYGSEKHVFRITFFGGSAFGGANGQTVSNRRRKKCSEK